MATGGASSDPNMGPFDWHAPIQPIVFTGKIKDKIRSDNELANSPSSTAVGKPRKSSWCRRQLVDKERYDQSAVRLKMTLWATGTLLSIGPASLQA